MYPKTGATEVDVGEHVCGFLRAIYPDKTAANVAADTGIPGKTVEKWLCGVSAPRSIHFIRLYCRYGPEFLCAVTKNPPAWLTEAGRSHARASLDAQFAALESLRKEIA